MRYRVLTCTALVLGSTNRPKQVNENRRSKGMLPFAAEIRAAKNSDILVSMSVHTSIDESNTVY